MIGIMAVLAFFLAVAWDPYMAMMADLFTEKQRGRVGGILGLGVGLGNITFAIIALTLWGDHEFSVFMIIIVVMISTWAYTFFTVKEPPASFLRERPSEKVGIAQPDRVRAKSEALSGSREIHACDHVLLAWHRWSHSIYHSLRGERASESVRVNC